MMHTPWHVVHAMDAAAASRHGAARAVCCLVRAHTLHANKRTGITITCCNKCGIVTSDGIASPAANTFNGGAIWPVHHQPTLLPCSDQVSQQTCSPVWAAVGGLLARLLLTNSLGLAPCAAAAAEFNSAPAALLLLVPGANIAWQQAVAAGSSAAFAVLCKLGGSLALAAFCHRVLKCQCCTVLQCMACSVAGPE